MLVAATAAPQNLTDTVMVCWKESANAARAVTAATPILAKAKCVVFTSVMERDVGAAMLCTISPGSWLGMEFRPRRKSFLQMAAK